MKKNIEYKKEYNNYDRINGAIVGWTRGETGMGHNVQIISHNNHITHINWRAPRNPNIGDQVTIVMHKEGVSALKDRPLMILNQTTGDMHKENNTIIIKNSKIIMYKLMAWIAIAAIISFTILMYADTFESQIVILISAALIVWRLAIATSDINLNDRAIKRKNDEEALCTQIAMEEWQSNTESRKPRLKMDYFNADDFKT